MMTGSSGLHDSASARDALGAPKQGQPGGRRRNWLGWGVAAVVMISCFFFVDPKEIGIAAERLSPAGIGLLLLVTTFDRLLMAYKWWRLLRMVGADLPMWQAIRIFYQGSFSGVFLPSHVGGDILRVLWVREATGQTHPALASLVMERMLGFLCSFNLALVGAVITAELVMPHRVWLVVVLAVGAALGANLVFAASMHSTVRGLVMARLERVRTKPFFGTLHRFYSAFDRFGADPRGVLNNALLTLLEQCAQLIFVYTAARCLGLDVHFIPFLAATTVYMMILRFPVAPDGWGVGELASIGVFGLLGVKAADAFLISILGHVIPMLALLPGLFFMLRGHDRPRPVSLGR